MLRSSFQSNISNVTTAPTAPASAPKNKLIRLAQAFLRFSKFYGDFVSTPIHKRKVR